MTLRQALEALKATIEHVADTLRLEREGAEAEHLDDRELDRLNQDLGAMNARIRPMIQVIKYGPEDEKNE